MPDIRAEIINQARALEGMAYRLDPPPDGIWTIDCSLFVLKVLSAAGVGIPGVRTAEQIRQACVPIAFDSVLPGDLLFFDHTYEPSEPPGPDGHTASHIGISLGAGTRRMWDANEAHGVGETFIGTDYWQGHLFEARRPPGLADAAADLPRALPRGIDVASHQGAVDWQAVAASGVAFGITKATGGTWYTNPTFAANWLGMRAAGIKRGAYHYAFETTGQPFPGDGPEAEADYFLKALERAGGLSAGDLLALDIEDGNGQLGGWALRFLEHVYQRSGVKPLVYTGAWFSVPHGFALSSELAAYPLWVAAYQSEMPAPPAPWDRVTIWQHSDSGRVPGVAKPVDLNLFNGTADELAALGMPGEVDVPSDIDELNNLNNLRAEVASLREQLADKDRRLNEVVSLLGSARGDVADAMQAALNRLRDLVPSP